MSERASEMCAVVSVIDPTTGLTTATNTGDVIDVRGFDHLMFILSVGGCSSSTASIILYLYEGTTSGVCTTLVDSLTITAASTGGSDVEDMQYIMDLDCQYLSGPNYRYVKPSITTATKNSSVSMVALGFKPRFHPASDSDLASVASITIST